MKNILVKVIKFILIVFIFINIFAFILLFNTLKVSEKVINKENITEYIDNIDMSKFYTETFSTELKEELLKIGISNTSVDNLLTSEELDKFNDSIVNDIVNRILEDNKTPYQIDSEELKKIIEKNIPELNIDQGKINNEIDSKIQDNFDSIMPRIIEKTDDAVLKLMNKIQNSEEFMKYKNYFIKLLSIFDILYSKVTYISLTLIIILFELLIIAVKNNIYKSLKLNSLSLLIPGIILILLNKVLNNLFNNISYIVNTFAINGIRLIMVAIILIIINIVWYFILKKKNNNIEEF